MQVEENEESPFLYRKIYTDVALQDGNYEAEINIQIETDNTIKNIDQIKTIQIKGHMYEDYYSH